jgi:hypothetical protein
MGKCGVAPGDFFYEFDEAGVLAWVTCYKAETAIGIFVFRAQTQDAQSTPPISFTSCDSILTESSQCLTTVVMKAGRCYTLF